VRQTTALFCQGKVEMSPLHEAQCMLIRSRR
jgi:hypothetical protein